VRFPGRHLKVGDLQVVVKRVAEGSSLIREAPFVSLPEEPGKRRGRGGLVRAGLPEKAFLAGDRIGSRVDLDPE
jgi:hypothetical protein